MLWLVAAIETGARQQALSEFLTLIEGRDLLLIHADKQIRQLQRRLTEKQANCARNNSLSVCFWIRK